MKSTTHLVMISLIFLFSCNSNENKGDSLTNTKEMDDQELTRVSMLIDPSPDTFQKDQINKLVEYALKHNWPVHKTDSGLLYYIKQKGNDKRAKRGSVVMVRYKGNLLDGTVFDQSPTSGEPVRFKVSEVIPAWQEALSLIGEDGQVVILAHSDLGYRGQRIGNVIPPYSPLIFEIELLDIQE